MNTGVSKDLILDLIGDDLSRVLNKLGGVSYVEVWQDKKTISDATTKMLIYNENKKKIAFLLCGFSEYSDISRRNLNNNQEFKVNLGKSGSALLEPMLFGESGGIEYSVWPYCNPLGEGLNFIRQKIQLFQIRPRVLDWLRNANKDSLSLASQDEIADNFISPLQQLLKREDIGLKIKEEINQQIVCLENNSWKPCFVLEHNDLWKGNVLINENNIENGYKGVTIIDWAGGAYRGFAINDLVRLSMSLNISRSTFQRELLAHCTILSCDKRNSMGYLMASFAFLSNNLGDFPEARFIELLHNCFNYLDEMI